MTSFGARTFDPTSLPKIDPKQTQAFKEWREVNQDKALVFEIGPGVGLHSLKYSRENPHKCLAAVEQTKTKFEKFYRRYINHGRPPHLLPVHANATSWAHHILTPKSLSECYILYPNPSPKSSDRNQRWHRMPFMERLIELIQPQGTLTLATNKDFYQQEARNWLVNHWRLELIEKEELTSQNWSWSQHRTHFERKYLQRGEVCYNLIFKKR